MKDMFIADFAYTSVAAFHITLVSMKKDLLFSKLFTLITIDFTFLKWK